MENQYTENGVKIRKQKPITEFVKMNFGFINFKMYTIKSDDTTVHDYFYNNYNNPTLELWINWCTEEGTYIDVGAHTGLYTIACLCSNLNNNLVAIEPNPNNYSRIMSNLRLNSKSLFKRCALFNNAVSDETKDVKFNLRSMEDSYHPKGGKIDKEGVLLKAIKLDDLNFSNKETNIKAIKIDTEGEDLNVLFGSRNLIQNYKPRIMVETRLNDHSKIISFLKDMGYSSIYYLNELGIKEFNFVNAFKKFNVLDIIAENIY